MGREARRDKGLGKPMLLHVNPDAHAHAGADTDTDAGAGAGAGAGADDPDTDPDGECTVIISPPSPPTPSLYHNCCCRQDILGLLFAVVEDAVWLMVLGTCICFGFSIAFVLCYGDVLASHSTLGPISVL